MPETRSFREVVRARRSVRGFLPDVVPDGIIRSVLDDARHAPSNCNTQPWTVHVVSGAKREALSRALIAAAQADRITPDFSFSMDAFFGAYQQRASAQGAGYLEALGITRGAVDERRKASLRNLEFFGAPHVALLLMPSFGDNVRVAGDIGMYGQTLLLSLAAHGLGGIPQTMLGFYADTIRQELGIDPSLKLLFGISFGYPDESAPANRFRATKVPLEESVVFHS